MSKRRLLVTDIAGLIFVGLGTAVFWMTRVQLDDDHYTDSARSRFAVACAIVCASGVAIGLVGRHRNRQARQALAEEACRGFPFRKTKPLGDQIATGQHSSAARSVAGRSGSKSWMPLAPNSTSTAGSSLMIPPGAEKP